MEIKKEAVVDLMFDDLTIIEEIKNILMHVQQSESTPFISSEHYDLLDRLIAHIDEVVISTQMLPVISHARKYKPAVNSPKDGTIFKIREVHLYGNSKKSIKAYWREVQGRLILVSEKEPNSIFNAHCYEWKPL